MSSPSIQEQEQYYTERWKQFSGRANHLELFRLARALQYIVTTDLPANPRICDFGCGTGWATGILGMFADAIGFDLSDTSAAAARFPHCRFVSGNALEWQSQEAGTFDYVTSLEVIEHIPYGEHAEYLRRALDLLKPGGHLILTMPNRRTIDALPPEKRKQLLHQPVECHLTRGQLRQLLKSGGWDVLTVESFVQGQAHSGLWRIAGSTKIRSILQAIGLSTWWERLLDKCGFGLHLAVFARKPN
jgi:SAM-dependent methyltransferase